MHHNWIKGLYAKAEPNEKVGAGLPCLCFFYIHVFPECFVVRDLYLLPCCPVIEGTDAAKQEGVVFSAGGKASRKTGFDVSKETRHNDYGTVSLIAF
jgi:hypothetical protein